MGENATIYSKKFASNANRKDVTKKKNQNPVRIFVVIFITERKENIPKDGKEEQDSNNSEEKTELTEWEGDYRLCHAPLNITPSALAHTQKHIEEQRPILQDKEGKKELGKDTDLLQEF